MNKSTAPSTKYSKIWQPIMLVLAFFIVFVVSVFPKPWHEMMYSVTYTLLFISAVMTMSKRRGLWLLIVCVILTMEWVSTFLDMGILDTVSRALNFGFFAFMSGYFIHSIARARKITAGVIFQAIIGYLLLGLVLSILIVLLHEFNPDMFGFPFAPETRGDSHFSDYIYFGFVTLTTLGYGDIVPLLPFSKSLSILISVSGQLYLAIIIAMLVGKYASQRD